MQRAPALREREYGGTGTSYLPVGRAVSVPARVGHYVGNTENLSGRLGGVSKSREYHADRYTHLCADLDGRRSNAERRQKVVLLLSYFRDGMTTGRSEF